MPREILGSSTIIIIIFVHFPNILNKEDVSGDTSEELLVEKLRRYGKRLELCDYMLRGFSFKWRYREMVSPAILKAVLTIGEVIPNDPHLNARLHEAVTYIMENLDVDDLTFEICQQVMQYTLSYILRIESGYQLLRLLINRFGIIPDGTYLNIQTNFLYMSFLISYITEMSGHDVGVDMFQLRAMLSAPTERIRENPDVIWSLYKSLKGSEDARTIFREMDALTILGSVERGLVSETQAVTGFLKGHLTFIPRQRPYHARIPVKSGDCDKLGVNEVRMFFLY
ncbi:unnamed protein product [Rodentolepis nana]|uniref:MIF4G domain-containing protein n=1 Tax=Rodentolepis nana TaxID=102285 RepID=A0A0R3TBC4_RODNA|nr:unnamed protein product [Rodentolepis nana]